MRIMELQSFSTLVSLLVLLITWLIVQPLKTQLEALQKSIDKLTEILSESQHDIIALRERVAAIENSAKSAHSRLDDFSERLNAAEVNSKGVK